MKYILYLSLVVFATTSFKTNNQASLTIKNNSGRTMFLKVMKGNYSVNDLHETVQISAYDNATVYFG